MRIALCALMLALSLIAGLAAGCQDAPEDTRGVTTVTIETVVYQVETSDRTLYFTCVSDANGRHCTPALARP